VTTAASSADEGVGRFESSIPTSQNAPHVFAQVPEIGDVWEDPAIQYGRLVVAAVVSIAALAIAVGKFYAGTHVTQSFNEATFGPFAFLVSNELPPADLVLSSLIAIVGVAAVAVTFEVIAALMSISPRRRILSSYRSKDSQAYLEGDAIRVTVIIPAHNEADILPVTLAALKQQSRQPDRVIVVADNCTDATVEIATRMGYETFSTIGNTHKKAGALNQVLGGILPATDASDVILVMDADTSLGPDYLAVATQQLQENRELSAVGGVFFGEEGHGLLGQFQRNEYTRYSLQIRNRRGRVFVLTGTATMFRAEALLDVAAARGVFIPGETGMVYDTAALTEDNEITLAMKSLGCSMTSPPQCLVTTELMPQWRNLWIQRKRWQRGALENLSAYGLTRATLRYWGQQVGIGYGTVALNLAIVLMLITFLSVDQWVWFPFWAIVGAIFILERVLTVWRGGWRARLLALALFPELAYDIFLQIVFVKCLVDISLASRTTWGHVEHANVLKTQS